MFTKLIEARSMTAELDEIDLALLAELKRDGRASISELALRLEVSRATLRTRMERLQTSGEIQGFTVLTRRDQVTAPVRGLMMIAIEGKGGERIMARLSGLSHVVAVHSTNGKWDMIVELATRSLLELDEAIYRIREIDGVVGSETNLLLSTRPQSRRPRP